MRQRTRVQALGKESVGLKKRIVVTGVGPITPIGIGKDAFWEALLAGKNGIERITRFDATNYAAQIAGEVKDFSIEGYIDKKEAKRMDRYAQFAVVSAGMAIKDAGLDLESEDRDRIGAYVGAGIGGIETMHSTYERLFDKGPERVSPFFIPMMIANMAAGQVAINYGLHGPVSCIVTACATGANCIGDAYRVMQRGEADVMIAGGTEASISEAASAGFAAMKALCTDHNDDPAHASRPFDKNRSGFVMSEGAGLVVLETLEHAEARGAHIYAELVGYGSNSDGYHITSPAPHGEYQAKCMQLALNDAELSPKEIDYVNAHGTSTPVNDKNETAALKAVFGDKCPPVSSTKGQTGHCLGGAGAIEAVISIMAMRDGIIPPTINYETPDPDCDLDYVPNKARKADIKAVMSNSFGFGGTNGVVIFKKLD